MESKHKFTSTLTKPEAKAAEPTVAPKQPVPKEVAPGIVHLAHKKIYHAEFMAGGSMINVGNFSTLEAAQSAIGKAKADLNM